jgi:hypothetical protein
MACRQRGCNEAPLGWVIHHRLTHVLTVRLRPEAGATDRGHQRVRRRQPDLLDRGSRQTPHHRAGAHSQRPAHTLHTAIDLHCSGCPVPTIEIPRSRYAKTECNTMSCINIPIVDNSPVQEARGAYPCRPRRTGLPHGLGPWFEDRVGLGEPGGEFVHAGSPGAAAGVPLIQAAVGPFLRRHQVPLPSLRATHSEPPGLPPGPAATKRNRKYATISNDSEELST